MKENAGYTLVEAIISVGLLSFVLLGVYGVLTTGNVVTSSDLVLVDMQQQARNGMERIVREVREASALTITVTNASSHQVTFTTPNETNVMYYLSGTNLVREYPANTLATVASNIGLLNFSQSGTLLQITIRADKSFYTRTISFALKQKVRLRNE